MTFYMTFYTKVTPTQTGFDFADPKLSQNLDHNLLYEPSDIHFFFCSCSWDAQQMEGALSGCGITKYNHFHFIYF